MPAIYQLEDIIIPPLHFLAYYYPPLLHNPKKRYKTMAELPLYSSLREELDSPPKISIQIIGSQLTDEQVKEIDFDLWVDCTKMVGIKSIKASTSTEELCHTWQNPSQSQDNPEDMLERWLNYWLNDCAERDRR